MNADKVVLTAATTTVGVTAGVMFCYLVAIMPGLARLSDREFVGAFQAIDEEIVNPLFVVLAFLGGGALLLAATVMHRNQRASRRFQLLAAASAIYVVGVVIVTPAWHVPKNDELADFPLATATARATAAARNDFEDPWNRLHIIRTLAAIASLVLVSAALLVDSGMRTGRATLAGRKEVVSC